MFPAARAPVVVECEEEGVAVVHHHVRDRRTDACLGDVGRALQALERAAADVDRSVPRIAPAHTAHLAVQLAPRLLCDWQERAAHSACGVRHTYKRCTQLTEAPVVLALGTDEVARVGTTLGDAHRQEVVHRHQPPPPVHPEAAHVDTLLGVARHDDVLRGQAVREQRGLHAVDAGSGTQCRLCESGVACGRGMQGGWCCGVQGSLAGKRA